MCVTMQYIYILLVALNVIYVNFQINEIKTCGSVSFIFFFFF